MTSKMKVSSELPAGASSDDPGSRGSVLWEQALVTRARAGESEALGELLRFYQARVFGLVLRYVGRRDEAAEVTQEAFLQAFRSIHRFEEGRPFRPWLFQLAVNVCRNHRRLGARREVATEVLPEGQSMWTQEQARADERLSSRSELAQLEQLLGNLTPDDRTLLLLRYNEELPYEELARMYRRPQAVLKMRVHRALKRLRQLATGGAS